MRLDTVQHLKLEQKMKLAPRMIQSMEILQLPIAALEERIEEELEKNPVLEVRETDQEAVDPELAEQEPETDESERELVVQDDNSNQDDFERLANIEGEIDPAELADHPIMRRSSYAGEEDPKQQALSNTAAREISLHEYLIQQWDLTEADPLVKRCGELIIDHLDPDGYFRTEFGELQAYADEPVTDQAWRVALELVQQLDPPGIAARSVKQCLLLQLDALDDDKGLERQIISECFVELQKQQYSKIALHTGREQDAVKKAIEFIGLRLILHPGLTIGAGNVPYIVPDVIIDEAENELGYVVAVPERGLPNLYVSGHYRRMLQDASLETKAKQFIRSNIQGARWLIDAIEQRRQTLKRVTESIVEAQTEFLENGPKSLRPLPMAQIADKVGIHVATVSRAVSGKYAQTPRGIFPLRMFFSGGRQTSNGENLSWDAVRVKMQDIIDAEDKAKPLADDQIVKKLNIDGIKLARRTVTKYRKIMGIPSSHRRRQS